jgi:hypothetical protein
VLELVTGFDQLKRWAGDQVEAFQDAIHARFRDEIAFVIGDMPG